MTEEITPAEILEALNDKADIDLGNVDQYLVKSNIISSLMPDYDRIQDVPIFTGVYITPGNTLSYTCPHAGWLSFYASTQGVSGGTLGFRVNDILLATSPAWSANYLDMYVPCDKGDVITFTQDVSGDHWMLHRCKFIPCKGIKDS